MTDAEIIRTIAEKVMGWKIFDVSVPRFPGYPVLVQKGDHWRFYAADGKGDRFDPLTSISDALQALESGEWDYVIRKDRSSGRYLIWIINSVWSANHPGEVPNLADPNLYAYGEGERLSRAISLALFAFAGRSTPEGKR